MAPYIISDIPKLTSTQMIGPSPFGTQHKTSTLFFEWNIFIVV
jgi:hypothetical protein